MTSAASWWGNPGDSADKPAVGGASPCEGRISCGNGGFHCTGRRELPDQYRFVLTDYWPLPGGRRVRLAGDVNLRLCDISCCPSPSGVPWTRVLWFRRGTYVCCVLSSLPSGLLWTRHLGLYFWVAYSLGGLAACVRQGWAFLQGVVRTIPPPS